MSSLGPLLHRSLAHAVPSAPFVERLSWRLSIIAIAGLVALVLAYEAPQPSRSKRDVHIEMLRTKPAPVPVPGQAHEPSEVYDLTPVGSEKVSALPDNTNDAAYKASSYSANAARGREPSSSPSLNDPVSLREHLGRDGDAKSPHGLPQLGPGAGQSGYQLIGLM